MEYKKILYTDLIVSSVCLGGAPFGSSIDPDKSMRLMDLFVELGGNFIDTANVYGKWLPDGRSASEETLGKWMKTRKNRGRLVVTTKGAHPDLKTMSVQRLSKEEISADVDDSLKNLQTDYIDLYWLHRDDPNRCVGEILESVESLVKEGKIRYYACSNWTASRLQSAYEYAANNNIKGFVADQMMWSLAEPNPDSLFDRNMVYMTPQLYKFHKNTGIAAIPYSSQANGFFSLVDKVGIENIPKETLSKYDNSSNRKKYERIKEIAFKYEASIAAVVLAYLLNQPFVVIPVAGFSTEKQMMLLAESFPKLSESDLNYLDMNYLDNS